jgi:hypothetical protein
VGGGRAREQKYLLESHMWPLLFDPDLSFANYRGVKGCYLSLEKQYRAIAKEYHNVLLRMRVGECQIGDIEFLKDTLPRLMRRAGGLTN